MTEENYQYRTGQTMLRNQFQGEGVFQIPIIPKADFSQNDFENLLLIGFDRAREEDEKNCDRMVHFFLYDYKFERVWKDAEQDLERLKNYRAVLSPDFSIYLEMNPTMQLYNTFRNRWCGAYWASKGLRVIPTVSWGEENTFDFCFLGIPKGSTVAVSTYMVSEHDNRCDQKEFFLKGYREMLRRIEPERIICYNTPFPEMEGNIIHVDYELSSWKYQEKEYKLSQYVKNISGELPLPENSGIIIKRGYVFPVEKGMGSAYGGQWKPNPNKPNDMIFIGEPNTKRREFIPTKKGGYWAEATYDNDGKADKVRHETDHGPGSGHTNPHDHDIEWIGPDGHPEWGKITNYPDGIVPDLKVYYSREMIQMSYYDPEALRFKTISDFKQSMRCGAEVVIEWKNKEFGIWSDRNHIRITTEGEKEFKFSSADEALEHLICGDRLREIITLVTVVDRTI